MSLARVNGSSAHETGVLPPVVILTMARSRSSLIAGLFHAHGCWVGRVKGPDHFNRTGYFENFYIKRLIKRNRPDADSYRTILKGRKPYPKVRYPELVETIKNDGYKGGPWLSKVDVFAWPIYQGKFVKVWRSREGILDSIKRTPFMNYRKFTPDEWRKVIDAHHEEMASIDGFDIDTDRLVNGDIQQLVEAIEGCGLTFNPDTLDLIE